MKLNVNGLIITLDDAEVSRLILQHFRRRTAPRIGEFWSGEGGVYAGIMRGRDGESDHHLIVGPELSEQKWQPVMNAAAAVACESHSDYRLPYRAEQALQFANVPELFQHERYWSCEQHATTDSHAWARHFGNGDQAPWDKDGSTFRARVVRKVPL